MSGVDSWPEDEAVGDIDAIVGPFAVQHTSVDSLPNGRERDVWFHKTIGGLEDRFLNKLGFRLQITFDWGAVQKGQDWDRSKSALSDWIASTSPTFPDGRHLIESIPNLPFGFVATKGGPLAYDGVMICRLDPGDRTLGDRLKDLLVVRHNKLGKLDVYQKLGKSTVLLLESSDIALMSERKICDALAEAFAVWPPNLSELWFMHYVAAPHVNVHDLLRGSAWIFDTVGIRVTFHNDDADSVRYSGMTGLPEH